MSKATYTDAEFIDGLKHNNDVVLRALYKKFYKKEPFIRVKEEGQYPCLKDVAGTNFCDIGIKEDKDSAIIIAAIDNLVKGASGQAVQCLNLLCGWPEETGLIDL